MAAVHRGTVSLAIRTINVRSKLAAKAYEKGVQLAEDLEALANNTRIKAENTRLNAAAKLNSDTRALLAAENIVLNARDDLNKLINA